MNDLQKKLYKTIDKNDNLRNICLANYEIWPSVFMYYKDQFDDLSYSEIEEVNEKYSQDFWSQED